MFGRLHSRSKFRSPSIFLRCTGHRVDDYIIQETGLSSYPSVEVWYFRVVDSQLIV